MNCKIKAPPLKDDPKREMGDMLGQITSNGKTRNYEAEQAKEKESMTADYSL